MNVSCGEAILSTYGEWISCTAKTDSLHGKRMRALGLTLIALSVVVVVTWYLWRFVHEVKKIKDEVRRIRRNGHAKSTLRRMKRERDRAHRGR